MLGTSRGSAKSGAAAAMRNVLKLAAAGEIATGLALLFAPSFVVALLLGQDLDRTVLPIARVTGLALIGLGIACWPGPPLIAMLAYSTAVAAYLAYLGLTGGATGTFLWPAVVLHLVLSALLCLAATRKHRD